MALSILSPPSLSAVLFFYILMPFDAFTNSSLLLELRFSLPLYRELIGFLFVNEKSSEFFSDFCSFAIVLSDIAYGVIWACYTFNLVDILFLTPEFFSICCDSGLIRACSPDSLIEAYNCD
jgi:hypothetical protein